MTNSDIWRDFDPDLDIPIGLKNVRIAPTPQTGTVADIPEIITDAEDVDITGNDDEDGGDLNEDASSDILDPPESMEIISQTVRTAPDGRQVVDIVIEVEDIDGATDYEVRFATT